MKNLIPTFEEYLNEAINTKYKGYGFTQDKKTG